MIHSPKCQMHHLVRFLEPLPVESLEIGTANIVLGGDSAGSAGPELRIRADPKVFLVGGYAIGFTTSFRMGQILRFGLELPEPPAASNTEEIERFLVTTFVPTVRQAYADHGFAKTARQSPPGTPSFVEQGQAIGGMEVTRHTSRGPRATRCYRRDAAGCTRRGDSGSGGAGCRRIAWCGSRNATSPERARPRSEPVPRDRRRGGR